MTDTKNSGGVPEAVRRLLAQAQGAGATGIPNPDPLPVEEAEPDEASLELSPEELTEECAREPETDIGNARRMIARHGDDIRHVTHVGWHGYTGGRWLEDASGAVVRRLAHKVAEWIEEEAILLDCDDKERAAIEAGRLALERMKEMGKPPSVREEADQERLAELDRLIAEAAEAEVEKVRLGRPKADWPDDYHELHRTLKEKVKKGAAAEREKRKMLDATSAWTTEQYAEYARLQKDVEALDEAEGNRTGRMSSRHAWAKRSASTSAINNMLTETAPYVSCEVNELNRDLYAINCESGTLRFHQVQEDGKRHWRARLDSHRPTDLISKLANAVLDRVAGAPQFEAFLKQVMPNVDLRRFLQRFMGYCLLGSTAEQCLLFFYGAGRNGKSTFVDVMIEILGDYAVSMSIDSFAGDKRRAGAEATPDLARLPGARMVAASEPEMGTHLKDALIKTLTGGEPIPVRRLNQDFFELIPQFKIILSGNHKPIIRDDSDGIWRRVLLVPWEIQIPEADVDRDLKRKLLKERAGIFAWLVKGALDYLENGLGVPDVVRAATAEYREESDPIGAFIRNGCHVTGTDDDRSSPEDLFIGDCNFARREGLSEFKQATFNRRLPDQQRKSWKAPDGTMRQFRKGKSGNTIYYGITVKSDYMGRQGEPPPGRFDDEPFPEDFG
ncbi:MAG: phage/plasmid primase, P4 family [Rhizobiaceae bacterium]|nr:phage/plasmid primase, P4 family [Rhizobiaceae bacterium]